MSLVSRKLDDYLKKKICNKSETQKHTHTRIGDKDLKIKGGSYIIDNEENFLEMYYDKVFKNNERQCKSYNYCYLVFKLKILPFTRKLFSELLMIRMLALFFLITSLRNIF